MLTVSHCFCVCNLALLFFLLPFLFLEFDSTVIECRRTTLWSEVRGEGSSYSNGSFLRGKSVGNTEGDQVCCHNSPFSSSTTFSKVASAGLFWILCLISRLTGTGLPPSGSTHSALLSMLTLNPGSVSHTCEWLRWIARRNGHHAWVHMFVVQNTDP